MRAVDCQGLAGAFTLGTVKAGFDLVAKLELPGGFGIENTEANRHLLGDHEVHEGPWRDWPQYSGIDYVFGNPPCSGFSLLNTSKKKNARGPKSAINDCMWALIEYAGTLRRAPDVVAFESVQGAYKKGRGLMQDLHAKMEELTGKQYTLTHVLMSGSSVGAAALRKRYFMVLHRPTFGVEIEPRERPATYRDALYDLKGLKMQWDDQYIRRKPTDWLTEWDMRRNDNRADSHISITLEHTQSKALKRWLAVLPYWKQMDIYEDALRAAHDQLGYCPGPWEEQPDLENGRFGFQQPKRIDWDRPAYVLTGAGAGQFVHPDEDRFLTVREMARIQGFPDSWTYLQAEKPQKAGGWIGKGVPVQSGYWLSRWVYNSLAGNPGSNRGEPMTDQGHARERIIDVTNEWKRWEA